MCLGEEQAGVVLWSVQLQVVLLCVVVDVSPTLDLAASRPPYCRHTWGEDRGRDSELDPNRLRLVPSGTNLGLFFKY